MSATSHFDSSRWGRRQTMLSPWSVLRLRRMLREWRPDVIHVGSVDRALLYTLAATIGINCGVLIWQDAERRASFSIG